MRESSTRFNLPDGTVVYLNSGSVLSYPMSYDQKERKVYLSGEAYFKSHSQRKTTFYCQYFRRSGIGLEF